MPDPSAPPFPPESELEDASDSAAVLATRLAEAVHEGDRPAAREALATLVAGTVARAGGSPTSPDDLRTAYEDLAARLDAAPVDERPAMIERFALRLAVEQLLSKSLALAIRRHVLDDPDAAPIAETWLATLGVDPDEADRDEVVESAGRLLDERDDLEERSHAAGAEAAEEHRVELNHVRLNLQAARSGSFETAAGMLRDYLADAGDPPRELDIH